MIAACLTGHPEYVTVAVDTLDPEDFYDAERAAIFRGIEALYAKGVDIGMVELSGWLRDGDNWRFSGNPSGRLASIMSEHVGTNVEYHAKKVSNTATARRVIDMAGKINAAGYEEANDPEVLMDRVQSMVYELISQKPDSDRVFDPVTLVAEYRKHIERVQSDPDWAGLPTGYADLDRLVGGLRKGEVVILAARPSVGKTALAECIAEYVADSGKFVVFASVEMTRTQLLARRASRLGDLPAASLLRGNLPEKKDDPRFWKSLDKALKRLEKSRVWIIDDHRATTSSLRADVSRARMRQGQEPDLIVIDYLQLLKDFAGRENDNSRVEYISSQVKALAREFNCPVLCLSQLSRQVEYRKNKTPKLADLRGSGAIEQDADVVITMMREPNEEGVRDRKTKLVVAKNRNGETGVCHLVFRPTYVEFAAYQSDEMDSPYA